MAFLVGHVIGYTLWFIEWRLAETDLRRASWGWALGLGNEGVW
jgi:hypothetical protein